MKFWNNIMNSLKGRKGEFTGTSGNEAKISERLDKEYKFRAGGPEDVKECMPADSKGRKTNEWKKTHRYSLIKGE